MAIATLTIDIDARLASLEQGFDRVAHLAEQNASRMSEAYSSVGKAIAALGLSGAAAGFVSMVRHSIDAADHLNDLSDRTGFAVETLNGLDYAARMSGGNLDEMSGALKKFNIELSKASAGDKGATDLLERLGVTSRDSTEALLQLADAFPKLSVQDRARASMELFGRSVESMGPLLASGREELEKMIQQGQLLNPVTTEMAHNAARVNDQLDKLAFASQATGTKIATAMLPAMVDLTKFTEKAIDRFGVLGGLLIILVGGGTLKAFGVELDDLKRSEQDVTDAFKELGEAQQRFAEAKNAGARNSELKEFQKEVDAAKKSLDAAIKSRNELSKRAADESAASRPSKPDLTLPEIKSDGGSSVDKLANELNHLRRELDQMDIGKWDALINDLQRKYPDDPRLSQAKELVTALKAREREERVMQEMERDMARNSREYADSQERLQQLLGGVTPEIEAQRKDMQLLATAFERGKITAEQFSEAASTRLKEVDPSIRAARESAEEIGAAFSDSMRELLLNTSSTGDLLEKLWQRIANRIIDNELKPFEDYVVEMMQDLAKQLSSTSSSSGSSSGLWQAIGDMVVQIFGAKDGAAFGQGGVHAFAHGGVFSSPHFFQFAKGGVPSLGVMGEAGPEAILPLSRGPGGALGVRNYGGGAGAVNVQVNLIESSERAGETETRTEGDRVVLDMFVEQIKASISSDIGRGGGAISSALERTYQLNRSGAGAR